jgi:hypothetical protein
MRLRKRLLNERLQRVRSRARSARTVLAAVRTGPHRRGTIPDAALPSRPADAVCGTGCEPWNDQPPGRRSTARASAQGQIVLRRLGSFGFQVNVRDISAMGCQVELVDMVELNDHVIARLPGLEPLGATVSWVDTRSAGLHFDRPMHPAVFEMLLARLV